MKCVALTSTFLLAVTAAAPARAALGDDAASIRADQDALSGSLVVTEETGYTVHEIQTTAGPLVREYVSADGKVFAVSWRGRSVPNLPLILGQYYARFAEAAQRPHADHHHLSIETPDFVLHTAKRPRVLVGVAYLPAALPQGVSAQALR